MSCLPKPNLRGHLGRNAVKMIATSMVGGLVGGLGYHFLVGEPRRRAWEHFLETYDPEAHSKEMEKAGISQVDKIIGS